MATILALASGVALDMAVHANPTAPQEAPLTPR